MTNDNLEVNKNLGSSQSSEAIELGRRLGLLLGYMYSDDDRAKALELAESMDERQLIEFTNALESAYQRSLENQSLDAAAAFKKEFESLRQSYGQSQKKLADETLSKLAGLEREIDQL